MAEKIFAKISREGERLIVIIPREKTHLIKHRGLVEVIPLE